jgi:hypothetical protein
VKNLLAGIMTKFSGSTVSTNVGGRIYFDQAPDGATMPYIVFSIVVGVSLDTFTDKITDTTIQFDMFSSSTSVTEISTIYANLRALFDDAVFAVTSNTLVRCMWQTMTSNMENVTTIAGTTGVRYWSADYIMTTEVS